MEKIKNYSIDFIFDYLKNCKVKIGCLDGYEFKTKSQRYSLFKKSIMCCNCKLVATHFTLERHINKSVKYNNTGRYHLNLYGIKDGREVLFTKDHITPKSKGGKDHITNYQTCCEDCNHEKGNTFIF